MEIYFWDFLIKKTQSQDIFALVFIGSFLPTWRVFLNKKTQDVCVAFRRNSLCN
jgi:hypothetical protein